MHLSACRCCPTASTSTPSGGCQGCDVSPASPVVSTPQPRIVKDDITRLDLHHRAYSDRVLRVAIGAPDTCKDIADHTRVGCHACVAARRPPLQQCRRNLSACAGWSCLQQEACDADAVYIADSDDGIARAGHQRGQPQPKQYLVWLREHQRCRELVARAAS